MISFNKGVLTLHDVPHWFARLFLGRKRFDAALKSAEARASVHGKASSSIRLGPIVSADITAEASNER